jgi:hypothetical protein
MLVLITFAKEPPVSLGDCKMLYRFSLAALLAGCAAGGMNSTPMALAPNGTHQAMAPDA